MLRFASRLRALVIEAVPLVSSVTADFLDDAGFEVVCAADLDDGQRRLEAEDGDFAFLFASVTMANRAWEYEILRASARRWPSLMILVTSAHWAPRPGELPADALFLLKPYMGRHVLACAHRMMEAKNPALLATHMAS